MNLARLYDRTAGATLGHGSELYYFSAASMSVVRQITASTSTDRDLVTSLGYNARHRFGLSADSTSFIGSYDGVTGSGATTAPAALPAAVTHLGIGNDGAASAGSIMSGWIRGVKFWPTLMHQTELNAATAL